MDAVLVRGIDELSAALTLIREGDDARTALELALLKTARPDADPSGEALAQRIERLERGYSGPVPVEEAGAAGDPPGEAGSGGPKATEEQGSEATAETALEASEREPGVPRGSAGGTVAAEAIDFERIAGLWPAVLDQVRQSGSELLSAVFQAARPVGVDAERATLEVGFPPSAAFNKRKAEAEANRDRLAEAVRTIVGESLRPVYVLLDGEEGDSENGEPTFTEEEMIERIKSEFDAEEYDAEEGSG
jgi:hypothetical protein